MNRAQATCLVVLVVALALAFGVMLAVPALFELLAFPD
jgi:hypothetical protein